MKGQVKGNESRDGGSHRFVIDPARSPMRTGAAASCAMPRL